MIGLPSPWRALVAWAGDAWRLPRLRFDDEQEARFIAEHRRSRLRHYRVSGIVALLVYDLFLLADKMMVPDVFDLAVTIRLCMFTPAAVLSLMLIWFGQRWVLARPAWFAEGGVALSGMLAAATIGAVLIATHSPLSILYRAGLLPVLIYGNLVQRLRFRSALCFTLFVAGVYAAAVIWMPEPARQYPEMEWPITLLFLMIAGYTLTINFRMEWEERRRFLRAERNRELRRQLMRSHEELAALSRHDALTGVPNRRSFDETLAGYWREHLGSGEALALMLIDVDHFKAYNDRYGHPAGDQCLRLVAQAMRTAVMPWGGFLARWGGEEFAVVLPEVDAARVRGAAMDLMRAVAQLQLRHEASPSGGSVTVSVGAAVCRPVHAGGGYENLLRRADAALYEAKAAGRHAWRCAPWDDASLLD
jgi:diguanylate cyclase (GGDEF)-like protein